MEAVIQAPKKEAKASAKPYPAPSFEIARIAEPNGSYILNRTKVGWKGTYEVQLKNTSNTPLKITAINGKIYEIKGGSNKPTDQSCQRDGNIKTSVKLPFILKPGYDMDVSVPVVRKAPFKDAAAISPYLTVSYHPVEGPTYDTYCGWVSK